MEMPWRAKLTSEQMEEKILESEQYITNYISWDIEKYKRDVLAWLTDKRMHYYFWHSKNEELKEAWRNFKKDMWVVAEDPNKTMFNLLEAYKQTAMRLQDTMDWVYEICFQKANYMVIWMKKTSSIKDKDARWYTIWFSKNEVPSFFDYCVRTFKHFIR